LKTVVSRWDEAVVELDAVPVDVLRDRIRAGIKDRMDIGALKEIWGREDADKKRLREIFNVEP
jgi:hypothetical protein